MLTTEHRANSTSLLLNSGLLALTQTILRLIGEYQFKNHSFSPSHMKIGGELLNALLGIASTVIFSPQCRTIMWSSRMVVCYNSANKLYYYQDVNIFQASFLNYIFGRGALSAGIIRTAGANHLPFNHLLLHT